MSENISTRIAELRDAVNRGGVQAHANLLAYLAILIYFFVAITSTTHEDILRETPKSIPLLNIQVPLVWFFSIGPWAILLIHLNQMIQYHYLTRNILSFKSATNPLPETLSAEEKDIVSNFLLSNILLDNKIPYIFKSLMKFALWLFMVIFPLFILFSFLGYFLPYHSEIIAWDQRAVIFIDAFLILYIWPSFFYSFPRWSGLMRNIFTLSMFRQIHLESLIINLVVIILCPMSLLINFPGEKIGCLGYEFLKNDLANSNSDDYPTNLSLGKQITITFLNYLAKIYPRNIELPNRILTKTPPSAEFLSYLEHIINDKNAVFFPDSLSLQTQGLDLRGRNLEYANFQGSKILFADFTNAKISYANFSSGFLGKSIFGSKKNTTQNENANEPPYLIFDEFGVYYKKPKNKIRAIDHNDDLAAILRPKGGPFPYRDFIYDITRYKRMQSATNINFENTTFDSANFANISIIHSNFSKAKLINSDFSEDSIIGSNFNNVYVMASKLAFVDIFGSNFDKSSIINSDLSSSRMFGSTFNYSKLINVNFSKSEFKACAFSYSSIKGSNFNSCVFYGTQAVEANFNESNLKISTIYKSNFYDSEFYNCEWIGGGARRHNNITSKDTHSPNIYFSVLNKMPKTSPWKSKNFNEVFLQEYNTYRGALLKYIVCICPESNEFISDSIDGDIFNILNFNSQTDSSVIAHSFKNTSCDGAEFLLH